MPVSSWGDGALSGSLALGLLSSSQPEWQSARVAARQSSIAGLASSSDGARPVCPVNLPSSTSSSSPSPSSYIPTIKRILPSHPTFALLCSALLAVVLSPQCARPCSEPRQQDAVRAPEKRREWTNEPLAWQLVPRATTAPPTLCHRRRIICPYSPSTRIVQSTRWTTTSLEWDLLRPRPRQLPPVRPLLLCLLSWARLTRRARPRQAANNNSPISSSSNPLR